MPLKKLSSLKTADLNNKKVFLRVDFNVPMKNGVITSNDRINRSLPTIKYILENGASLIIATHMGRPKGRVVEELKTAPVAERLSELLGKEVKKAPDCVGEEVDKIKKNLKAGGILMLENTRFHNDEEQNTRIFSKDLASGCDLFVEDAFASVHRAHSSTVGIAHCLPSYAGFLLEKEIEVLSAVLKSTEKSLVFITGGAKIDSKIGVMRHFLRKASCILLGGGIANTVLHSAGFEVGKSLYEAHKKELSQDILFESEEYPCKIVLPSDAIVAKEIREDAEFSCVKNEEVESDDIILDIGEESAKTFIEEIEKAKIIVWNGPLGLFEYEIFSKGTRQIAEAIANSKAKSIIGGGDTIAAIDAFDIPREKFSHVSTGGGAMIEFLEGKILPGLSVLK